MDYIAGFVINLFRKSLLTKILEEVQTQVMAKATPKINDDLKGLTHYEIAGVGVDFSMIKPPTITDNDMLSLFMNGTFYSADNSEGVPKVTHPNFEVGTISRQDLMLHIPESFIASLFNSMAGKNGLNITEFMLDIADHQLTLESFCRINEVLCQSGPNDEPVNLSIFLNKVSSVAFSEDRIDISNATVTWKFSNGNKLLTDYTLTDIAIGLNIQSRPEYAQIYGSCDKFEFTSTFVGAQGSVWMDNREVLMDNSDAFDDFGGYITNQLLRDVNSRDNRYKKFPYFNWDSIIFKEMEVKIVDQMAFIGVEFDPMFIGRPQNWQG